MPTLSVNNIKIYYEQEGKGKPIVLIAGYTCDLNYWAPIRSKLAKHFQVTLFDNRGVGRSEVPDTPYTIDNMVADTVALIEKLQLKKPHLIGSSMGTAVAQLLAAQHSQLIDKIVLTNPCISFDGISSHAFDWILKLQEQGIKIEMLIEGILPWIFSENFLNDPNNVKSISELILNNPYPQSLVAQKQQFAALRNFNSSSWFKNISVPTLVIGGDEDICTPIFHAKKLAAGISGAKLHIFPNMGHAPNCEEPDKYLDVVLDFFNSLA